MVSRVSGCKAADTPRSYKRQSVIGPQLSPVSPSVTVLLHDYIRHVVSGTQEFFIQARVFGAK